MCNIYSGYLSLICEVSIYVLILDEKTKKQARKEEPFRPANYFLFWRSEFLTRATAKGEDEATASSTTRAIAKGEDEATASSTTRAIAEGGDTAAASLTKINLRLVEPPHLGNKDKFALEFSFRSWNRLNQIFLLQH